MRIERCQIEQKPGVRAARKLIFQAEQFLTEADGLSGNQLQAAVKRFEEALRAWDEVVEQHSAFKHDRDIREESAELANRHSLLLSRWKAGRSAP